MDSDVNSTTTGMDVKWVPVYWLLLFNYSLNRKTRQFQNLSAQTNYQYQFRFPHSVSEMILNLNYLF